MMELEDADSDFYRIGGPESFHDIGTEIDGMDVQVSSEFMTSDAMEDDPARATSTNPGLGTIETMAKSTPLNNNNTDSSTRNSSNKTHQSAESVLAQELNKLSFRERETIHEEIHGIGDDTHLRETPERLAESLRGLQEELDRLCREEHDGSSSNSKPQLAAAYKRSRNLPRPSYLDSDELRSMFLRCERFDCHKAAIRLCHYANLMYELYSDIGLERKIKLSDIPPADLAAMRWGLQQVLPSRDRAGRRIFVHFHHEKLDRIPDQNMMRMFIYYVMSCLYGDAETQRRGIVFLFWWHNYRIRIEKMFAKVDMSEKLSRSIPFRAGAMHFLFPSSERSAGSFAFGTIISSLTQLHKSRIRLHLGSPMECSYILQTFGIAPSQTPLDPVHQTPCTAANNDWLDRHAAMEERSGQFRNHMVVECPRASDVLFGKGLGPMNHQGNLLLRRYIRANAETYRRLPTKQDRKEWTEEVANTFQNTHGVRFLKEETINGTKAWVEVSTETARTKIRIAFRDAVKKMARETTRDNNTIIIRGGSQKNKAMVDSSTSKFCGSSKTSECCS